MRRIHAEWLTLIEVCKTRDGPMMLRALRGDVNWSKYAKDDRRWARIGNVVNSVSSMLLIHLSSFAQRSSILSWCFYAQGTCFRVPLAFIKASTSNSVELFVLVFPRLVVVRPTIGFGMGSQLTGVCATLPQYIYTSFLNSWHRLVAFVREASNSKPTDGVGSLSSSSSHYCFWFNVSWFYHSTSCALGIRPWLGCLE